MIGKLSLLAGPPTIFGLFLRRQLLIGAVVIVLAALAIQHVFQTQINNAFDQHVIELAAMIDNAAAISGTPEHLKFVVRELTRDSRVKQILILSARDGSTLASSRSNGLQHHGDGAVLAAQLARRALLTGHFNLKINAPSGDHYSVVPLSLAAFLLSGDNILATSHWSTPRWYVRLQGRLNAEHGIWSIVDGLFYAPRGEAFTLPVGSFSGVMVINSGDNWIVDLMRFTNACIAVILFLVLTTLFISTAFFFRFAVKRPLNAYASTIEQMRAMGTPVHKPLHGIREFDAVATQWNDLVDEQIRTRQALDRSQNQFRRLIDSLPGFAYICSNDERWTMRFVSASSQAILGYAPEDIIDNRLVAYVDLIHPDDRQRVWSSAQANMAAHRPCEIQYRVISASGAYKWVWERGQGVYDDTGTLLGIEGYIEDITALKQHEHDLMEARSRAEAANRAKSAFIANTNHEIRTPLNAIVGFSEMLAAERLGPLGNPEYREFAGLIENSGRALLAIISTIMDLSRMQAGDAVIDLQEVNPGDAIGRIVRLWGRRAAERGIVIGFRNAARQVRLSCDEHYLCKIIDSLLSNAVKFSSDGGKVQVSLRLDKNRQLTLAVRDHGIGIAGEHLSELTSPFYQVDKRLDRSTGGIGLGMTMVKECTGRLGANLDITSRPGKGTCVKVIFPASHMIRQAASQGRPAKRLPPPAPRSQAASAT